MTKKVSKAVKSLPVKKSGSKNIKKSAKSNIPEEQKCLTVSVNVEDGVNICQLIMSEENTLVLAESTGCKISEAAQGLITNGMKTITSGMSDPKAIEVVTNDYLAMMAELKPQDAFEGLLISQMTVTHSQAMESFRMANNKKEYSKLYERFQNQGIKLMRVYNQQLETLDKHRRKGNQKMTVEHVHVHPGGQAIVGTVNQGEVGA